MRMDKMIAVQIAQKPFKRAFERASHSEAPWSWGPGQWVEGGEGCLVVAAELSAE